MKPSSRKIVFGVLLLSVATSIVFSMIGVLAVWNPMELFGYAPGQRP
ncbi:hypothetical protein M0654_12600 [Rhizobium sp. NTR19]|uniref:Uncharacterized protein n=1 Tax=Neorhizobium turbinariae TaxID=2937795 RepID=A0ABT0ISG8_9HYPH|nr:hypothetical protein [Neorhizobium turbinariae]MCK8780825.1 hypothetical protein [Neorhizobium turbinariae]